MAVQAQYPSNVLFLNRSGQDEFPLQQQGGVYVDQAHMFFNNGSNNNTSNNNNQRKRGREEAVAEAEAIAPINSFSLQTQPTQFIDISQLQRPNVVSTGLRLSFGDQQQYLHQNQNQSYERQQQNLVPNSSAFWSVISDDLGTQIKRQREELEQFLQSQGEELRRTLVEKRHRYYRALLGAAEESVVRRLRDKEAEVEKATRRNAELEARLAQLNVQARIWQAKAGSHEATVASLQAQLQQAIMSGGAAAVQDIRRREECGEGAEDAESAYMDPERVVVLASGPGCKACRKRLATVVLLPCRHLCLCTECDRGAQICPLCLSVRNSSVEAFLN